jgi:peptidoglycan/LPS O-acetylase OafA/YrhL
VPDLRAGDAPAATRQIPALDGIRGLAIIWVILHNATDEAFGPPHGLFKLLAVFTHSGWIGVQLFFALSGFLITAGLLESQGEPHYFRNFYAKRALRILPLYYTVLLVVLVILPRIVTLHAPYSNDGQASLWLFTVNVTHVAPYGFAHFWSLAVEEQFYLFWPLVVCWLSPRPLLAVCLWTALGALLLRCALAAYGADWWTLYTATPCRMDALALGGAGACVMRLPALREGMKGRLTAVSVFALVLFLAGIPLTHNYDRTGLMGETLGYSLLALCSAAFVTASALPRPAARTWVTSFLAWAPLRSCGKYSYAMYIFHGLLHKLVGEPWLFARFGEPLPARVVFIYAAALILVSYVLGFCSYQLLEKHFLRLKQYLNPAQSTLRAS